MADNDSGVISRLRRFKRLSERTALLMIGIPDYETYLAHMQSHHPEHSVMSRAEFIKRAQEGRYAGKKLNKCPC